MRFAFKISDKIEGYPLLLFVVIIPPPPPLSLSNRRTTKSKLKEALKRKLKENTVMHDAV